MCVLTHENQVVMQMTSQFLSFPSTQPLKYLVFTMSATTRSYEKSQWTRVRFPTRRDVYVPQDVTVWLLHQWQICRLELIVHHNEPMNKRPSFEWCFQRHHLPDLQDTIGLHFASDLQKGFEWTFVAALSPHESHVQMLQGGHPYIRECAQYTTSS